MDEEEKRKTSSSGRQAMENRARKMVNNMTIEDPWVGKPRIQGGKPFRKDGSNDNVQHNADIEEAERLTREGKEDRMNARERQAMDPNTYGRLQRVLTPSEDDIRDSAQRGASSAAAARDLYRKETDDSDPMPKTKAEQAARVAKFKKSLPNGGSPLEARAKKMFEPYKREPMPNAKPYEEKPIKGLPIEKVTVLPKIPKGRL